jgi:hypothetical protein
MPVVDFAVLGVDAIVAPDGGVDVIVRSRSGESRGCISVLMSRLSRRAIDCGRVKRRVPNRGDVSAGAGSVELQSRSAVMGSPR